MMKTLCLLGLLALVSASDVLEFTDSDFAEGVGGLDLVLVKFYAPWCGHCKRLAPEFDKAASALLMNDPPIYLAKVDCTAEVTTCEVYKVEGYPTLKVFRRGALLGDYSGQQSVGKARVTTPQVDCTAETKTCGKFGVSGYPTLKIFRNGEQSDDYNGPRDADGIIKYMRSKAGPSSKTLLNEAEAEKFLDTDDISVVGFFTKEDSEISKQFTKLADALNEDFRFAHSFDPNVLSKYGYSDDVVIFQPKRLQSKFEDSERQYTGDISMFKLKSWVNDNVHGLTGHRTVSNQGQFKRPLVVAYYDVDYVKNTKGTNYWRNRVMKVAKKVTEAGRSVYFAVSNADDFSHELSEFGATFKGEKPLIAAKDSSEQKFVMEGEFSMDALEKFVNDLLDGKLEPYLKSEPIPASQDEPVKTVVAKNFDEIVNDDSKDVLIEFYAPWCGHCKSLAPKYEELATKLADEPNIVIAKMDATANDVPKPYEVRGFPTIYFSPAGSKKNPKKYEGGREVDDFIKYLAQTSTSALKGYDRKGKKVKSKTEL